MPAPRLELHDDRSGSIRVVHHGTPLWTYQYGGTPKPYAHPFHTPSGETVTLAAPHDHVHHRGLMLAWRVNEVNFWEEAPQDDTDRNGQIVHEGWDEKLAHDGEARLAERLAWTDSSGTTLLRERRLLRVRPDPARHATLCLWESRFTADQGALLSGRTRWSEISYYGLGCRFARALDHGGRHLDSEGETPENGKPARWHSYQGRLDETGTPVGVLMCDAPSNPRHPTPWFFVSQPPAPFAYVTASFVAHEEYHLAPGAELVLCYGVWVHEGPWDAAACEAAWTDTFSS